MELLQLAGVGVVFLVVLFLWLRIIYLPARTMEHWEGNRPRKDGDREEIGEPHSGRG